MSRGLITIGLRKHESHLGRSSYIFSSFVRNLLVEMTGDMNGTVKMPGQGSNLPSKNPIAPAEKLVVRLIKFPAE